MKQKSFFKTNWRHHYSHGGSLRQKKAGRGVRPLSSKDPLHVVFKINIKALPGGLRSPKNFALVINVILTYGRRFFIKIEQISIQRDHIHLLIRTSKRSFFHHFFRVVAGQIAQRMTGTPGKIWKYRPFTRVIRGWKPYHIVRDYIQLNEKEALGDIPYRKERLAGLSMSEWELLWQ